MSWFFFLCFLGLGVQAQDTIKEQNGVLLSAVVIADMNKGFDVDKFITRVRKDSTFYKAFKSLSLVSCTQYNDIEFFDKKGNRTSFYNSVSNQVYKNSCRTMTNHNIKHSKNYFKKKNEPRFITAKFYHKLFMLDKKRCNENDIVGGEISSSNNNRIDQLKKLIFKPGESINGVPGVGGKVGIFEKGRKKQYIFTLDKVLYNGDWCYLFKAKPKAGYLKNNVINYLDTWIRISDHAIVRRNYSLSYSTMLYDFNVEMKVKLKTTSKKLVPYEVLYKGDWHFVGKKRERANFACILTDFH